MAYNLEEQEQLEALKDWWKQYGNFILAAVTIALFSFSAYMGWKWYQRTQSEQATLIYEALLKASQEKNTGKVKATSTLLLEKYSNTIQAEYGALLAARVFFDAQDLTAAKTQLQWLIDHGKHEEYQFVARLRLAGILLDEKKYDAAIKLLATRPPQSFVALYADQRGDILMAQNKVDEARTAYDQALAALTEKQPMYAVIELKREGLGVPISNQTLSQQSD